MKYLDSELNNVCFDHAWSHELEDGLEAMLERLHEGVLDGEDPEGPSGLAVCGCGTCFRREVIAFLLPAILEGQRMGLVHLKRRGCCDG